MKISDEDRATLRRIVDGTTVNPPHMEMLRIELIAELSFRAGLERAARICRKKEDDPHWYNRHPYYISAAIEIAEKLEELAKQ